MNDTNTPRVPKHSARRAGMKQKRVDPTVFRAIVQQQAEIERLNARVAELEALGGELAGTVEDYGTPTIEDRSTRPMWDAVKAWYAATQPKEAAL